MIDPPDNVGAGKIRQNSTIPTRQVDTGLVVMGRETVLDSERLKAGARTVGEAAEGGEAVAPTGRHGHLPRR
jgi:hypothetical protein